jgi:DNA-binding Lrp family transcriptional regulator
MSYAGWDWAIFNELVMHGPATPSQLVKKLGCSQGAVKAVKRKLEKMGYLKIIGHAPRPLGKVGATSYILDVGEKLPLWALKNVKPREEE